MQYSQLQAWLATVFEAVLIKLDLCHNIILEELNLPSLWEKLAVSEDVARDENWIMVWLVIEMANLGDFRVEYFWIPNNIYLLLLLFLKQKLIL